jgi:hypothetical protein
MARVPIVREIAWIAVLLQLAILALFIGVATVLRGGYDDRAVLFGGGAYVSLSFVLRSTVSRHHRAGVRLMKALRFEDALPLFERSADYFGRHPAVDKLRGITLLSASRMSYREMSLCNIAFGLAQTERRAEARAAYERVIREYTDNPVANAALRMIAPVDSIPSAPVD